MYCMQCCMSCFVVRGCAVSSRYINVCKCDIFSVVNVYLDHLKFCIVCIDGRRYVCCSEYNIVSNECNEPTPALCNRSAHTVVRLCTVVVFALGASLVSCIVIIYARVLWISSSSSSSLFWFRICWPAVWWDLSHLYCWVYVLLLCLWSSLVCLWDCRGTLCGCDGCCDCDACTVACVYWESVMVRGWRNSWCGGWMRCSCGGCRGMWVVHVVQVLCLRLWADPWKTDSVIIFSKLGLCVLFWRYIYKKQF